MIVSLQTKIESLEEEIKNLKNENSNFKDGIKTLLKIIENISKFENKHCEDSVTNKYECKLQLLLSKISMFILKIQKIILLKENENLMTLASK